MATTSIRTRDLDVGGFRTGLVESGDPKAPPVVLVHDGAYGTDALLCWEGVINELAPDHYVVAPDLLGWGRSDKLCYFDRSPYDFRLRQIAGVVDALAIDAPVCFVGVSFGAELVVRGVAETHWGWNAGSAVVIAGTGGRLYRVPGAIEQLSSYEPDLEAARRLTAFLVNDMTGLDEHVRRRYENSLIPGHWEALSALRLRNPAVERTPSTDRWPEPLGDCHVPILFVEGASDRLLSPGWAAAMAELAPAASAIVVPGAHEPNLEHPVAIGALIRNFASQRSDEPGDR